MRKGALVKVQQLYRYRRMNFKCFEHKLVERIYWTERCVLCNFIISCRKSNVLCTSILNVISLSTYYFSLFTRGGWIRIVRNDDNLWKENSETQRLARQHIFCKASQCTMLDKMVTDEYKKPHYYVDDPYEPYHNREEFIHTRTKPRPPSKNVYKFLDD